MTVPANYGTEYSTIISKTRMTEFSRFMFFICNHIISFVFHYTYETCQNFICPMENLVDINTLYLENINLQ